MDDRKKINKVCERCKAKSSVWEGSVERCKNCGGIHIDWYKVWLQPAASDYVPHLPSQSKLPPIPPPERHPRYNDPTIVDGIVGIVLAGLLVGAVAIVVKLVSLINW